MGAVKTAGRGREPEDSPVADQTVTVGRAAILMFCGVEHLTDEEREIHTLSNFPYRRTRRYPGVSIRCMWRGNDVPICAAPHGMAVISAVSPLATRHGEHVFALFVYLCCAVVTITRILYLDQLSPDAQGHTIPSNNTQTDSHTTQALGEQSASLILRFSTPTQRSSRINTTRRRRAPPL